MIPLVHYITLYEMYHFFGPPCICLYAYRVSVCLSVQLRVSVISHISKTTSKFHQIFRTCHLWSWLCQFSNDSAISYVFLVLWMASCFHVMGPMDHWTRIKDNIVWSNLPDGGTGGEVAVHDCRFVSLVSLGYWDFDRAPESGKPPRVQ